MTRFDKNQYIHYKKILANYAYQKVFSQSSYSEDFLLTPLFEINNAAQNLCYIYDFTIQDSLRLLSQNINIISFKLTELKVKNNTIRKAFQLNQKQTNELIKQNANILNYNENQLVLIHNCLSNKLNFSQQDIYECLINNYKIPYQPNKIIEKYNYIKDQLGYTQNDAITLCRLSSVLSLSIFDISKNINFLQNKLKFDKIADIFPIFNCSFAENANKGNLLTKTQLPIRSIVYLWQTTYNQLLFQKEYLASKYPTLSPKLCFLPYQDFNNKLYKETDIADIFNLQAYKRNYKSNNNMVTFYKQREQKTNNATINKLRVGKRIKITKSDKINAKLICKTQLNQNNAFIKTCKIEPKNIQNNQKNTIYYR